MSTLRNTVGRLPKLRTDDATPAPADERDQVRQTLYLPRRVHDQLRELAHAERTKQQPLFREALNLLFASRGLPSWDELK